jgi:hypothetical protein
MLLRGRCHCDNIGFALTWDPDPVQIAARACGCTFCSKHGGVWTANPAGALRIAVKDSTRVNRYAFGTRTAEFHVCSRCGVVPLVTSRIAGRLYAVVSINACEDLAPGLVSRAPANFDGEGEDSRLARRQRTWIPDVQYVDTL